MMSVGRISLDRRGHMPVIGADRAARRNAFDVPSAAAARLFRDLAFLVASEDMQQGLRAFLERRPGELRGR